MKNILVGLALSLAAISAVHAAPMSGADVRKAVAGKTMIINVAGHSGSIRYHANGSMSGRVNGIAAALAGQKTDRGKWWISGNQLCQRWSKWMRAKSYCYRLQGDGSKLTWLGNDGRSGTARLGG